MPARARAVQFAPSPPRLTLAQIACMPPKHRRQDFVAVLAVLAAAGLRLVGLARWPPGLHFDEAVYGLQALEIVHGARPVFFSSYTGREPLYMYALAAMFAGAGASVFVLRLTSALIGVVTVALTYPLGRALYGRRVALVATWLIALSYWHVTVSRNGYPNVLIPPLGASDSRVCLRHSLMPSAEILRAPRPSN